MLTRLKSLVHGASAPWATLALTATLIVLHMVPGAFDQLVYDRAATSAGQPWRLVTGHFVHLDWNHLATNAFALLGLGALIETKSAAGRTTLLGLLGLGMAAISTAIAVFSPATGYYAGLSGVLNGLFAYACLELFAQTRHRAWLALLLGGAAKIAWEASFGPLFSSGLAWPSHTLAHAAGLASGIALHVAVTLRRAARSWYFPWARCPLICP